MREYFTINNQFKKYLPIFLIMLSVIILMGTSYALLRSSETGTNPYVMKVGLLEVTFQDSETNVLNVSNMVPVTDDEGINQENEFSFVIKNTGTLSAKYSVYIEETSTSPAFKTVIKFISNKNDTGYSTAKLLSEDSYIDTNSYLGVGESATYKLKVWLKEEADATYMDKTFTARIVVDVSQDENVTAARTLTTKVGTDGLVGVTTDGSLYSGTGTIREYRYSGTDVNNYVYFNCSDTDGTYTYGDTNYDYENNCEVWRIIGVFKNSAGEWNLKLMRNTTLSSDEFPSTYVIDGTTYQLEFTTGATPVAYWNNPNTLNSTNYNDWTKSGLQYFLNTESDSNGTPGYYSTITDTTKGLIDENYIYNLGNVYYSTSVAEAYEAERKTIECDSSITSDTHNNSCNIWSGNQATWNGTVGLLYPSDYGYSVDSSYWNILLSEYTNEANTRSWMQQSANHTTYEWFLSPSSDDSISILKWDGDGNVSYSTYSMSTDIEFRPVINMISSAKIKIGDGSSDFPYVLVAS